MAERRHHRHETNIEVISCFTEEEISMVKRSLSNKSKRRGDGYEEHEGNSQHEVKEIDTSACDRLGREQNQAFQHILAHIKNKHNGAQEDNMLLIIHGGPGVGKSTMTKELVKRLQAYGKEVLSCAPTGIAASLLVDGRTMHNLFMLPKPKKNDTTRSLNMEIQPLSYEKLLEARDIFQNAEIVLIDEASMIDPIALYHINCRLKQIKACPSKHFGGLPVALLGDFFQLKPVKATAFFDAVTKEIPLQKKSTPYAHGCELIKLFKMVTFTEQFRSKDAVHTASINQMRRMDTSQAFTQSILDSLQILSPSDLKDTVDSDGIRRPSPYRTAPIIVACNLERQEINLSQAVRFAKAKGVPVLRWQKDLIIKNDVGEAVSDLLHRNNPLLTGIFVEGAPAHLKENLNANSGLANGTPTILHSILLSDKNEPDAYREIVANATPGEIIDIPVPHAIVVDIPGINPVQFALQHKSLVEGKVVIPLVYKKDPNNVIKLGKDQKLYYKSHSYDIAFGITFHKIQGQTVPKIILDLNKRPGKHLGSIDFHALYVALTRVEYADDIRILPCQDDLQFKHLLKLKPTPSLSEWLNVVLRL
jgi:hypothetical protein